MANVDLGRIVVDPSADQVRAQAVQNAIRSGINPATANTSSEDEILQMIAGKAKGVQQNQTGILEKLLQSGVAAVEKSHTKQIEQAMIEGGADALGVLSTLIEQYQKGKQAQATADTVQQQPAAPTDLQQQAQQVLADGNKPVKAGIMGGLIDLMSGGGYTQAMKAGQLDNTTKQLNQIAGVQKITGQEPLQAGKREELNITAMNTFFDNITKASDKPISAESSKLLGNVDSGIKQIDALSSALEKDPGLLKKWVAPGNAERQMVDTMLTDLSDIIGRLRSGGAITKDEEDRFRQQIPKKGLFEDVKTSKFKLKKLRDLMSDIKQSVEPKTSELSGRVQAALQAGATREQIYKIYQAGGM